MFPTPCSADPQATPGRAAEFPSEPDRTEAWSLCEHSQELTAPEPGCAPPMACDDSYLELLQVLAGLLLAEAQGAGEQRPQRPGHVPRHAHVPAHVHMALLPLQHLAHAGRQLPLQHVLDVHLGTQKPSAHQASEMLLWLLALPSWVCALRLWVPCLFQLCPAPQKRWKTSSGCPLQAQIWKLGSSLGQTKTLLHAKVS